MADFPVPETLLQDCFAVLGKRGSGKSTVGRDCFEHELDAGHRAVLVDPKGDSWGIRLEPDGVTPSRFDIPIFGGSHGDYALTVDMGAAMAELVATHDFSCIIDLSDLIHADQQRFMLAFAQTLLQKNRAALTLYVEEAHVFAPQITGGSGGPTKLIGAMAQLVKMGRQRGIVMAIFTQRPAEFSKSILSMIDSIVVLRVISPNDRDTFKRWFEAHSAEAAKEVLENAAKLKVGESFVFIGEENYFERVTWPMHSTYDSGRAPRQGEAVAAVDLAPLTRSDIAEALAGFETADNQPAAGPCKACDAANRARAQAEAALDAGKATASALINRLLRVRALAEQLMAAIDAPDALAPGGPFPALNGPRSETESDAQLDAIRRQIELAPGHDFAAVTIGRRRGQMRIDPADHIAGAGKAIDGASRKSLTVLAILAASHKGLRERAWAMLAGIDPKKSTWRGHKANLRGLFDEVEGRMHLTDAGAAALRNAGIAPAQIEPGQQLVGFWKEKLSGKSALILQTLADAYPSFIYRGRLSTALDVDPASSTWRGYMAPLRKLELIEEQGDDVRIAQELMEWT